jgi:FKBP-type peptidyl-prolyl cis-trans isomerase FklB
MAEVDIFYVLTIHLRKRVDRMKGTRILAIPVTALIFSLAACQSGGEKDVKLESKQDKVSYSIGRTVGTNIHRDSIALTPDAFLRGVMDAWADSSKQLMTDQQVQEVLVALRHEMNDKQAEQAKAAAATGKAEGEAFLAKNAKEPGVVVLPSGLQYKVIKEGKGKKPTLKSTVVVNYSGHLIDGKVFDSSYEKGEPVTYPVSGFVKGWVEALQLMSPGSKWQLYVPSELGYGDAGAGNVIPPGATLIFELELISVK